MKTVIYLIFAVLILVLIHYLDVSMSRTENFEDSTVETTVIKIYNTILERDPNSTELMKVSKQIRNNELTYLGLQQRLINTDEYQRIIKVQSNSLSPELPKILSDKDINTRLAFVYKYELTRPIPDYMVFPIKDIYIRLEFNENAVRAMLRDIRYPQFEEDIKYTQGLDYQDVMTLFETYFNKQKLFDAGTQLTPIPQTNSASDPMGVNVNNAKVSRTIYDTDTNSQQFIQSLLTGGNSTNILANPLNSGTGMYSVINNAVINGSANGTGANGTGTNGSVNGTGSFVNVPTHQGDMVLDPRMAWAVPQPRPPVCTTLGQAQPVQSIYDQTLPGTPLNENNTGVGSIMPKFNYNEYVQVQTN